MIADQAREKLRGRRVYVAGHRGMVGAALVRALEPCAVELVARTSLELDLRHHC